MCRSRGWGDAVPPMPPHTSMQNHMHACVHAMAASQAGARTFAVFLALLQLVVNGQREGC